MSKFRAGPNRNGRRLVTHRGRPVGALEWRRTVWQEGWHWLPGPMYQGAAPVDRAFRSVAEALRSL